MSNLSNFRARYGNRLERLDYRTPESIQSLYFVTVLEEQLHAIRVEATFVHQDGGHTVTQWLHLDNVVTVWEKA